MGVQKNTHVHMCTHHRSGLHRGGRANISLTHNTGSWLEVSGFMRGCIEHTDKEHRNRNHAHRMCVCVWCRCPCWLIACSFGVQLSQIPPFSPSTAPPSLSFFSFSLSLPRSASPKTHCLLATKALKINGRVTTDKTKYDSIRETCQKSSEFGRRSRELQFEGVICLRLPDQRRSHQPFLDRAAQLQWRPFFMGLFCFFTMKTKTNSSTMPIQYVILDRILAFCRENNR